MSSDVRNQSLTGIRGRATARGRGALLSPVTIRTWHAYVSAFIAPTIVFFACSGILQILDLHQAHGSYTPSALVSSIASLHKDQVFAPPPPRAARPRPSQVAPARPPVTVSPVRVVATQLLKWLFILEALGLVVTTLFGVSMGIAHAKRGRSFWWLLGAGTLVPVVLAAL